MSLIDKKEFLRQVVRPALDALGLRGGGADILVLGTALTESGGLRWIRQVGGPALGFFQIEPNTHDDMWMHWIPHKFDHATWDKLHDMAGSMQYERDRLRPSSQRLVASGRHNTLAEEIRYGAAICRLIYRRRPEPLPDPGNPLALAMAWKLMYNTVAGKGTVEKAEPWFREAIRIGIELDTEGRTGAMNKEERC